MLDWPAKDPGENLDFAFDWAGVLSSGETLSSKTVVGDGVTVQSSAIAGSKVNVWLSGGTEGTIATVSATVVTSDGRTFREVARLAIGGGPISLAAAKAHLKVDWDDDDVRIAMMLRAAVAAVEGATGRVLSPRPMTVRRARFPALYRGETRIELPVDPVIGIDQVDYIDGDDNAVTMASGDFRSIAGEPWSLIAPLGGSFPATAERADAVTIHYRAGFAAGQCPPDLEMAVLEVLRATFDGTAEGGTTSGLPAHVEAWCWRYRRIRIG